MLLLLLNCIVLSGLIPAAPTPQKKSKRTVKRKNTRSRESITLSDIQTARERLAELGYWVKTDVRGKDDSLYHALVAFQKIEGRERTGRLSKEELDALRDAQPPTPLEPDFAHIEVDLQRQVLFVINIGDEKLRVLPISSGSGEEFTEGGITRLAVTPTGRMMILRKIPGWRESPLGLLYYPCYFVGGVAIHGNPAVPTNPASHGCVRIPMFAAIDFFNLAEPGTQVVIHDGTLPPRLDELIRAAQPAPLRDRP